MRIRERSAERLVIEDRPWGIPLLCMALCLSLALKAVTTLRDRSALELGVLALGVLSCGAMAWVTASRTTMVLDAATNAFSWHRRFGVGLRARGGAALLSQVERAQVETRLFDDGRNWRTTLIVDGAPVALTEWFGGTESRHATFVQEVNAWLSTVRAAAHS